MVIIGIGWNKVIVVKIELWPHGFKEYAKPIGEVHIWNKGGTETVGEYGYKCFSKGVNGHVIRQGELKGFPRLRLLSHDLLLRCLAKAFGSRNNITHEET
jgi:hypothetical protein